MRVLERFEENIAEVVVSVIAAGFISIVAWFLTIFVGAKFFRDELGYGIPLASVSRSLWLLVLPHLLLSSRNWPDLSRPVAGLVSLTGRWLEVNCFREYKDRSPSLFCHSVCRFLGPLHRE
jgi:hypothetical protein